MEYDQGVVIRRRFIPQAEAFFSVVPSVAFTPASLTGLIAWFKADTGVYTDAGTTLATNTQTVQQWNDQSGNNYHLKQSSAGARPQFLSAGFNSLQTVDFTFAALTLMFTDADSVVMGTGNAGSCFVVCQMRSPTQNTGGLIGYLGNGQSAGVTVNTTGSASFLNRSGAGNAIEAERLNVHEPTGGAPISLATNYRLGSIYDGANQTPYVNNVAQTTTSDTNTWTSPGRLIAGCIDTGQDNAWDGPVSEIVITNAALSPTDRTNLDNYFKTKWGL